MPDVPEAVIRRYLLGLLPEAEAEALEQEALAHPEVVDAMRGVEDDLLDDHAAGRLAAAEAEPFERRYLASAPQRARVVAARGLARAVQRRARPAATPRAAGSWGWRGPLALAATILMAFIVFRLWPVRQRQVALEPTPQPSAAPIETPRPASPSATPPPRSSPPALSRLALALSPGLLRGAAGPAELHLPGASTPAVLDLELDGDRGAVPPGATVTATLATVEGRPVWSGRARLARSAARPELLAAVSIPAGRLAPGDYLLTLSAGGQVLHRYSFRALSH